MADKQSYTVMGHDVGKIRNRQEVRVLDEMRSLLPIEENFCCCGICVEDVYAVALTALSAQYVQPGTTLVSAESASDDAVTKAVAWAVERVSRHPKHPK